jgi:hypothetical protein
MQGTAASVTQEEYLVTKFLSVIPPFEVEFFDVTMCPEEWDM